MSLKVRREKCSHHDDFVHKDFKKRRKNVLNSKLFLCCMFHASEYNSKTKKFQTDRKVHQGDETTYPVWKIPCSTSLIPVSPTCNVWQHAPSKMWQLAPRGGYKVKLFLKSLVGIGENSFNRQRKGEEWLFTPGSLNLFYRYFWRTRKKKCEKSHILLLVMKNEQLKLTDQH